MDEEKIKGEHEEIQKLKNKLPYDSYNELIKEIDEPLYEYLGNEFGIPILEMEITRPVENHFMNWMNKRNQVSETNRREI